MYIFNDQSASSIFPNQNKTWPVLYTFMMQYYPVNCGAFVGVNPYVNPERRCMDILSKDLAYNFGSIAFAELESKDETNMLVPSAANGFTYCALYPL
jgi:hypothetical protein